MSKQKNFICSFKSMWKSKVYTTLGQHRVIGSWISAACVRWGPEKMRSRELPTQASGDWSHTQGHRWPVVQRPLSDLIPPESDSTEKQKQLIVFTFCFLFIAKSNLILVFFMSGALLGARTMFRLKVTG